MKRKCEVAIIALVVLLVVGMFLSYTPSTYYCNFTVNSSDYDIEYVYDSNYGMGTNTVLIETDGNYDIQTIIALFDPSYASMNDSDTQFKKLNYMKDYFDARGLKDFFICNATEIVSKMNEMDVKTTAFLFISGSIPDIIYNGTVSCPLIEWLDAGGTMINMFGCLGKYVSTFDEYYRVSDYVELFTGVSNNGMFRDSAYKIYGGHQDETIQESLNVYINECTYGIKFQKLIDPYLCIGSVSDEGYSSALIFKSRNGMVMQFSASMHNSTWVFQSFVQVIASGLDYSAEILDWRPGDTRDDNLGSFSTDAEHCHVYGYVGDTDQTYAEKVIIR